MRGPTDPPPPARVLYLHGFASSPASSKARFFRDRWRDRGVEIEVPELTEGDFEHTTLTRQLALVTRLVAGDTVLLVGSSLGGYLAALLAARRPERVAALVLLAPAFGMARRWSRLLTDAGVAQWRERGWLEVHHYGSQTQERIGYGLLSDAAGYEEFPAVTCPTLLLHGRNDETVDHRLSVEFAAARPNVELELLDSDHQLLDVLEPMWARITEFLDRVHA
jgi:pimeloyl-ACP methyl ester carboxylesterase